MTGSYSEQRPVAALDGVVRTVWVHRTGPSAYVQRHLPTGGVEIHVPVGGTPRLLGPLTQASVEVLPPHTTVAGVRFWPGAAPLPAVDDLVDRCVPLDDAWPSRRIGTALAAAPTARAALEVLQRHLVRMCRATGRDPVVAAAVAALMPWHRSDIAGVAGRSGLSVSQLRRRVVRATGLAPKPLQRTLRLQGFLALAQAGAVASGRRGEDGMAGLAVDVGYADQAHLGRECVSLTGVTPRTLLGGTHDRCACGHDHAASYGPFLATRPRMRDSFKTAGAPAP